MSLKAWELLLSLIPETRSHLILNLACNMSFASTFSTDIFAPLSVKMAVKTISHMLGQRYENAVTGCCCDLVQ